jgi:hypothetical protein
MSSMVRRRLVKHIAPKHPLHHRHHATPPGLVSGVIYALAATLAIALGYVFFRNVQRARSAVELASAAEEALVPDLPPNVKVIKREDSGKKPAPVAVAAQKSRPAAESAARTPAASSPTPQAQPSPPPESNAAVTAAVASAEETARALAPLPPPSWSPELDSLVQTETVQLLPKADTAIFSTPRGDLINAGAATNLPIRGNEAFFLAQYDTSPVHGWTILRAQWVARIEGADRARFGFSAVMAPWQEGSGTLESRASNGATFAWADFGKTRWRDDRLPFSYMIRGNGGALYCLGETPAVGAGANSAAATDGWIRINIDPAIVQAMAAGLAHGLAVSDERGQLGETWWVPSREAGTNLHYLLVEGARADILPPGGVKDVRAVEHPLLKRAATTGVILQWTASGDDSTRGQAFAYDIRFGPLPCAFDTARTLPFYKMPRPQPAGKPDRVIISGLTPDTTYALFVRSLDESGQLGPIAQINYRTPPVSPLPDTAEPAACPADSIQVLNGKLVFQAAEDLQAVSPFAKEGKEARTSRIWDRNTRTIRLRAARNETIGFFIQLGQTAAKDFPPIRLIVEPWKHPKQSLDATCAFYRVWFSRTEAADGRSGWAADALLPLADGLVDIRRPDNRVLNASRHFVWSELAIAADAPPGKYVSRLLIADEAASVTDAVNVVLDVLPIDLSQDPQFVVELTTTPVFASLYKKSGEDTAEVAALERAYHALAEEHGCVLAIAGADGKGWAPEVSGRGADLRVTSWSPWDTHMAARGGRRQVAAGSQHVVLPLSGNWPIPWREGFRCSDKLSKNYAGSEVYLGEDRDIFDCLGADYWTAWRCALQNFREHLDSTGARGVAYHVWFAGQAGPAQRQLPWNLGAPIYRSDFMALEAFSRVVHSEAKNWPADRPLLMRAVVGDASLLPFLSSGAFGLVCVSNVESAVWDLCGARAAETGETFWQRSPAASPEAGHAEMARAVLRAEMLGAAGWSVEEACGRAEDWARAASRSLLYCGAPFGREQPYPSLRLKAVRHGLQDLAYLRLLARKMGWTRDVSREFLRREIPSLDQPDSQTAIHELQTFRAKAQDLLAR